MEVTEKFLKWLNENSLYKAIGIQVEEAAKGEARARLEPSPALCWPFPGQPHGGVLFTLMDTTMACAVFSELDPGYNCATINTDIQYTSPAKGEVFTCFARTIHRAGHLSFARAEIHDSEGQFLAAGQAAFRIVKDESMAGL
ncbi:MAG: PaaI family thioesterase [Desulfobacteraceae bacterium]|jgi:uncharacterized protein (TIGR00369 family)